MYITIRKITEDYPYGLLLQADETREAIDKYLFGSDVYEAVFAGKEDPVGVFCLFPVDEAAVELKNIAVDEPYRGTGIGSLLIGKAVEVAAEKGYGEIIVGTGTEDCAAAQIRFYEKNGFHKYGLRENFFVDNYPDPIYENGVRLKDMLILRRDMAL